MAAGAAIGVFNGSLVAYGKLPPFIVTLGMLGIARGVVLVLTDASTVQPLPDAFGNIANGSFLGLPNLLWIFLAVVLIASFVLRRTVFGRYVYAVGSNPESARLAGVPVTRVLVSVYAIAGLLAAVGGVLFTSRLNAGIPTAGTGYELNAIAACVIGGASLFGAKGGAFGAAAGALIVGVLNNGGNLLGHQLLLPADHHRRPHPGRRRLRPVAGPAVARRMSVSEHAGQLADAADLVDVDALIGAYFDERPDPSVDGPARGLRHLRAPRDLARHGRSTRPTCSRSPRPSAATASEQGIDGPLFLGRDTHALSEPAAQTHRRGARRARRRRDGRRRRRLHADAGDLARDPHPQPRRRPRHAPTASSSPRRTTRREDGGFKYNPPHGGPADTDVTGWIQREANALLEDGLRDVKRTTGHEPACTATTTSRPTSTTCPP